MVDSALDLTLAEQQLRDSYMDFYDSLETGQRKPATEAQEHFVKVCHGRAKASTEHELAYVKYMRLRARLRRAKEEQRDQQISIPLYEEGYPTPGWFTDEDWEKMRKREFSDMRERHRS